MAPKKTYYLMGHEPTTGPSIPTLDLLTWISHASYDNTANIEDITANGNNWSINNPPAPQTPIWTYDGTFFQMSGSGGDNPAFGGITSINQQITSTLSTLIVWVKTTDTRAMFLSNAGGSGKFLGAYNGGAVFHSSAGSPLTLVDGVASSNLSSEISDGVWHMVEFKSCDFSTWTNLHFNRYSGGYQFGTSSPDNFGELMIYDRVITSVESETIFDETKGQYSITKSYGT